VVHDYLIDIGGADLGSRRGLVELWREPIADRDGQDAREMDEVREKLRADRCRENTPACPVPARQDGPDACSTGIEGVAQVTRGADCDVNSARDRCERRRGGTWHGGDESRKERGDGSGDAS
jgi:hypothetical protein